MSEAFLGILPHFNLFLHMLCYPCKKDPFIVDSSRFQFQADLRKVYFSVPLKPTNKGRHANWFYCSNPIPSLTNSSISHQYTGHRGIRSQRVVVEVEMSVTIMVSLKTKWLSTSQKIVGTQSRKEYTLQIVGANYFVKYVRSKGNRGVLCLVYF